MFFKLTKKLFNFLKLLKKKKLKTKLTVWSTRRQRCWRWWTVDRRGWTHWSRWGRWGGTTTCSAPGQTSCRRHCWTPSCSPPALRLHGRVRQSQTQHRNVPFCFNFDILKTNYSVELLYILLSYYLFCRATFFRSVDLLILLNLFYRATIYSPVLMFILRSICWPIIYSTELLFQIFLIYCYY